MSAVASLGRPTTRPLGKQFSGLAPASPQAFPVKPGDRVTVAGTLQPDGSVLAGAVSRSLTIPPSAVARHDRILFGRVSSGSSRYGSRDIKIRLADDREVKVKVARGLPIRRDGRPVSVHDLRGGDDLRVLGRFEGGDFRADRINVLARAGGEASRGQSRPGL